MKIAGEDLFEHDMLRYYLMGCLRKRSVDRAPAGWAGSTSPLIVVGSIDNDGWEVSLS